MEITQVCNVKALNEKQVYNKGKQNEFKKQSVVLETMESKTPLKVDFNQTKTELVSDLLLGQMVLVTFVVTGNYDKDDTTKIYNSLTGVNLKVLS